METQDLSGSAAKYLDEDDPAFPYMFVVEVARDCSLSKNYCVELAYKGGEDDLIISISDPIFFIERMYLHPGTKSGPAVVETIMSKLIHFRKIFTETTREITD